MQEMGARVVTMCQTNPIVRPSIRCDECGCESLADWLIRYDSEGDDFVSAFACSVHLSESLDPEQPNIVRSIGSL